MPSVGFPILSALLLWWFATGIVLYLDGLPRSTCRWSMPGLSGVAVAALYGLWASSDVMTTHSADCALLVWGWHEMSFRTGFVTGPRTLADACNRAPGLGPARACAASRRSSRGDTAWRGS